MYYRCSASLLVDRLLGAVGRREGMAADLGGGHGGDGWTGRDPRGLLPLSISIHPTPSLIPYLSCLRHLFLDCAPRLRSPKYLLLRSTHTPAQKTIC